MKWAWANLGQEEAGSLMRWAWAKLRCVQVSHDYLSHNCLGHNYLSHNYLSHNYSAQLSFSVDHLVCNPTLQLSAI